MSRDSDRNRLPPLWASPGDFGQPMAFESKTGVAAPLLAGFSLSLLGVVGQAPTSFRWPGLTMSILSLVTLILVTCVQFGFRGRAVLYSRADVQAWGRLSGLSDLQDEELRAAIQRRDMQEWRQWHRLTQVSYNLGIVLLALGMASVMAPPGAYTSGQDLSIVESIWRWVGCALCLVGAILELAWMAHDASRARRTRRALGMQKPRQSVEGNGRRR